METLIRDIRYGARSLLKQPAFTALAVFTLALGIGANAAVFSVVNAYLLRPLPFKDPNQLVFIYDEQFGSSRNPASFIEFTGWREQSHNFADIAAMFTSTFDLTEAAQPERIRGARVSATFLPMLGVKPIVGQTFSGDQHKPGAAPAVIISDALWHKYYGGDAGVVGKSIKLNETLYTIRGVLPAAEMNLAEVMRPQLWVPLEADLPWRDPGTHYLQVVGRLKPGISLSGALIDLDSISKRLNEQYQMAKGVSVRSVQDVFIGDGRTALRLMLAGVVLVLLIACANVANLLLARATVRVREISIRMALGASRFRIIRQMLVESLVLSLTGGVVGTLLALWSTQLLVSSWPHRISRPSFIGIDWRVLGFTLAVSLLSALVFGVAPAFFAAHEDLNKSLKGVSSRSSSDSARSRLRGLVVTAEVALSTVFLIGTGLLVKSYWRVVSVAPGFQQQSVLALDLRLAPKRYKGGDAQSAFFQRVLDSVAAIPGVDAAGAINSLPLRDGSRNGDFEIEGLPPFRQEEQPETWKHVISPDYFRAMSIRMLAGRSFSDRDTNSSTPVTMVNQSMVKRFWPHEDPIGKRIDLGNLDNRTPAVAGAVRWRIIVGVVEDVRHLRLDEPAGLQCYIPLSQWPSDSMVVVVRSKTDPLAPVSGIKAAISSLDTQLPILNVRTLSDIVSDSVESKRLVVWLASLFGLIALLLAAVGLFGVISQTVAQRTHEIGIRMALGATASDVQVMILRRGIVVISIGCAAGLTGALAATRVMKSLLYGVTTTDLATFGTVTLTMLVVGLLATYLPARRATKVDPLVALRYE